VILGRVHGLAGQAVPEATIALAAPGTARDTRTDVEGRFLVTGVGPGRYEMQIRAPGHRSVRLAGVEITPGLRTSLDIALAAGDPGEWLDLDPRALATLEGSSETMLSGALLQHLPLERRHAITEVPDYLPGIARGSAYGAAAGTSTVRRVDGIDLTDPRDGSAWTSYIATAGQQVAVRAQGAGAWEGGFSNALVDVVTEPGGTRLAGLVDVLATTEGLASDNLPEDPLAANRLLPRQERILGSTDISGMAGGALNGHRTRLHAGFGYARYDRDPFGPRTSLEESTPRVQGRLSFGLGRAESISVSALVDWPRATGLAPPDVAGIVDDAVADRLSGHSIGARVGWQRPLGDRLLLDVGYGLLSGSRNLEPSALVPGRMDPIGASLTGSQGIVRESDRLRHQIAARLTRDLIAAGRHAIQIGAEFETSHIGEAASFVDDTFFVDLAGRPNLLLEWDGDHQEGRTRRESVFVDDTWSPLPRLTLSLGVRADFLHGSASGAGELYAATTVQPRVGAAFDLLGGGRTVARAHYGIYADPLYFSHFARAAPGITPIVTYEVPVSGGRREVERSATPVYAVDDSLRHPRHAETAFGLDQRLARGARVGVTAVFRDFRDHVDAWFPDARWTPLSRPGLDNSPVTVYRWVNRLSSQSSGIIGNVEGASYLAPNGTSLGTAEASRRSRAIVIHGRLDDDRERWSILGGITLAHVEGTLDNTFVSGIGSSSQFESASTALTNVEGRATQTPEREYTVLATARVPWVGARVSVAYIGQDGRYYQAVRQFGNETLDFPLSVSGRRVLLEPLGTRALEMDHRLDLRAEYGLSLGTRRVTAYVDLTNLLNEATVLRAEERYPLASAGGSGIVLFEAPIEVRAPRQLFIGARLTF
jgi:hypothetical protein